MHSATISIWRREVRPFSSDADRSGPDLRRSGGDRDRERAAVQGAAERRPKRCRARWSSSRRWARSGRRSARRSSLRPCSRRSCRAPCSSRGSTPARSTNTTSTRRLFRPAGGGEHRRGNRRRRCARRRSAQATAPSGAPRAREPTQVPDTLDADYPARLRELLDPGRAIARCSPCRCCARSRLLGALLVQPQVAGRVRAGDRRAAEDVRHPVGARDPERAPVPRDRGERPAARRRRASTSRSSSPA